MKHTIPLLAALLLAPLAAHAAESTKPASKAPNILFILTEDQGAHLSYLGTPGLQTPNMDSLAKSGVYFQNFFVGYPVCSPSKACIYTSLHNHTNGILNNTPNYHKPADQLTAEEKNNAVYRSNRLHEGIPTLVERLKEAGYYQGVIHKLHVAPVESFPYDEFIAGENGKAVAGFIERAGKTGKPWHLFFNVGVSHRPFPNSDKVKIRVKPEDVKLPADALLGGEEGKGFVTAMQSLDNGRLSVGAAAAGYARRALDSALRYANERKAFGEPIANFQLIQQMLAESEIEIYAAECMLEDAARRADAGENVLRKAAAAKVFASEMCGRVVDRVVQIYGGAGYLAEYDAERFFRDARIYRIYEGTTQILQLQIAKHMLREWAAQA